MIKRNIPNAITLGNLLCGCLAIVKAFEGDLVWSAYLVGIAAVLDFFDGFAARMLHVSSPIGKDLDSLADMVTFGVVPGIMMFQMIHLSSGVVIDGPATAGWTIYPPLDATKLSHSWLKYIAFIIPIFSCIRLAKFNNDTRQSESFIGLPTPANSILICSAPLFVNTNTNPNVLECFSGYCCHISDLNPWFLVIGSCVLSFLLIAPIPLFSLKFKSLKWKGNELRYLYLLFCIVLLVLFQFAGIPLTIISYVLISLVNNIFKKQKAGT